MIWYIAILAIVMFLAFSFQHEERQISHDGMSCLVSTIRPVGFLLIAVVLILFEGFRSSTVGTDTGGYCRGYMYHSSIWWMLDMTNPKVVFAEPGLRVVSEIASCFSSNYISFLTVGAVIMVGSALTAIRQNSINFTASLFVYITLAFYLFGFAGIRQGFAISIYIWGICFLKDNKTWQYIGVVLIAALFHKSIIVALPFFLVARLKFNTRNIVLIIIIAMFVGWRMNYLVDFGSSLEERYAYYTQTTKAGSGFLLTLFCVSMTVFYMIERRVIPPERLSYYDRMLFLLIIASAIYLIVTITKSNTELNRFAFYFQAASIFLFAEYYTAKTETGNRLIPIILILIHIGYYLVYVNQIGGISDYQLNPILTGDTYSLDNYEEF